MSRNVFWSEFNRLFEDMDKFLEHMDRLFEEARKVKADVHIENPDEHKIRFRGLTVGERSRYAWRFFCMTISMVFRGHSTLKFKRRTPQK
jgi:hypothetical protein